MVVKEVFDHEFFKSVRILFHYERIYERIVQQDYSAFNRLHQGDLILKPCQVAILRCFQKLSKSVDV